MRAFLREAIGCGEQAPARLSEAERAACARREGAKLDPNRRVLALIDPQKSAWFDASVAAHAGPLAMRRSSAAAWASAG